ncbi:MAG TPA: S-adenosylmethionine decarboxylase [Gemmatimonadales bacterium]|nr:S-adenosylmethionine decarboxylase [Gemmatimonadales bacterium]
MSERFNQALLELTDLVSVRLADVDGLSSVVVAAAGAVGMATLGPPIVREGPRSVSVGLLCQNGHVVVHAIPSEGICLVDVVAREPADASRGAEVIARRFGAAL